MDPAVPRSAMEPNDPIVVRFLDDPKPETYAELFRLLVPQVFRYFRVRGCDHALAEDLAQEVMLALYRRREQLKNRDLFRPWLFQIARNTLLQHIRQRSRRPVTEELQEIPAAPGDPLAKVQFSEWMQHLDAEEREMVRLKYVDGMEFHEIARTLEKPQGTVQWKVFQAVKKLAARFGPARKESSES